MVAEWLVKTDPPHKGKRDILINNKNDHLLSAYFLTMLSMGYFI